MFNTILAEQVLTFFFCVVGPFFNKYVKLKVFIMTQGPLQTDPYAQPY